MCIKGPEKDISRDQDMIDRFTGGETMTSIGESYGISRERVRQILKRYDLTRLDGGRAKKSNDKLIAYLDYLDNKYIAWFGCIRKVRYSYPEEMVQAFWNKKRNVLAVRKVKWDITLPEYCEIWEKSGLWGYFGINGANFTRIDFAKPWTKDNVQVLPFKETLKLRGGMFKNSPPKRG